jgi:transposase-like protein
VIDVGKGGRPTRYDPERHPFLAACLARDGLTEKEIAERLEINPSTLTRWKQRHPDFCTSLKGSRAVVDGKVETSLFKRALGYEITETEEVKDGRGKVTRKKTTVKQILPDVTAQIFWLKNRQPEKWRDAQPSNTSTLDDLAAAIRESREQLGKGS